MLENSEYHSELKMGHGTSKIIIQHEMIIKIYSNTSCFFFSKPCRYPSVGLSVS